MNCIKCKKSLPEDALYCCYCGKKQLTADKPPASRRRSNGEGTVYKRDNSWVAEYTQGYKLVNGKKRRICKKKGGFKSKRDAIAYLAELRQGVVDEHSGVRFFELWEKYQPALDQLSSSKQYAYNKAWSRLEPSIGLLKVSETSVADLQGALNGDSYYILRDQKLLLSHLYQIALREELTDRNRSFDLQLPQKDDAAERRLFTDEDIEKLWSDYQANKEKVTAAMLVMLYTGMRPAEILGTLCENVHLDDHYLTGGMKTKKGKRRKIIIPDRLATVISDLLKRTEDQYLCNFGAKSTFYDAWNKKREDLGFCRELQPYCCRHTYVTRLTALRVSPAMLQELVGHEDYDTTLEYTHLSVEERLKEVNKLK